MGHILHPWQKLIPTVAKLATQPQVSPHVLAHAKLVTLVVTYVTFMTTYFS